MQTFKGLVMSKTGGSKVSAYPKQVRSPNDPTRKITLWGPRVELGEGDLRNRTIRKRK